MTFLVDHSDSVYFSDPVSVRYRQVMDFCQRLILQHFFGGKMSIWIN